MEQIKEGISDIDNKLGNVSDEKFLFLFSPEISEECICGCSQKIGVQIISFLLLLGSIGRFLESLSKNGLFDMIIDICISVFFLLVAFFMFYSTISLKYEHAYIGYIVYSIIWILNCLVYCCNSIMILFYCLINLNTENLGYILGEGINLAISLYFIWIIYCFTMNLKKGKSS